MKGKYSALFKDLVLFTISTFIPKAISFCLMPLYTNCLTTAEYGIADLLSTTVSLFIPFFTLDVSDAVMRFTIENKNDAGPFKIGVSYIFKGILLIIIIVLINNTFKIIQIDRTLELFFVLNYTVISLYGICIAYLRATDRVGMLSVVSMMITIVTICSNIIFLVVLRAGLIGYLISGCIGYAFADLLILIRIKAFNIINSCKNFSNNLKKQMVSYSIPLIAANISWWINSSSDRYFVTMMCGVDENGVYSVAYKIPTILQMLQTVFSQAWLLSVFREYKNENGPKYVSSVYELYNVAMSISCAVLIVLDIPLAKFLYAKGFFVAWMYVPILLLSVVFIANAGFFESMLTLHKKSKIVAGTTIAGAGMNIMLNIVLIQWLGTMGAAIATVCGYLMMWLMRIRPVMNEYPFEVNWHRNIILYLLLVFEIFVMLAFQNYYICIALVICMCVLSMDIIKRIIKQIQNHLIMLKNNS